MTRALGWLATALVGLLSGCSYLWVTPPPPDHAQRERFACTEAVSAPAADVAVAVAGGGGLMVAGVATAVSGSSEAHGASGAAILGGAMLAGVLAASAAHGFQTTQACERAKLANWVRKHRETRPAGADAATVTQPSAAR